MLDPETRDLLERIVGRLVPLVDRQRADGDASAAAFMGDATDSVLALLDFDATRRGSERDARPGAPTG